MSWDICIYAEYKDAESNQWVPLYEKPVFESYKLYKDDFYDSLKSIKSSDCSISDVRSAKQDALTSDTQVKVCSLNEFNQHYNSTIDKFNMKLRSAYLALDLGITIDYDDIYVEQEFESDESYNNESILFSRMTNPVSKKLMIDLASSFNDLSRAHEMIGLCNAVYSMAPYGSKIRLVFVTM